MSEIGKIALTFHLVIGIGCAFAAQKCSVKIRIVLVVIWPLIFGCWLGERCNEAMEKP